MEKKIKYKKIVYIEQSIIMLLYINQ